jgi:hypothetical protein
MRREWAMPNTETFDIPVIGAFVRKYLAHSRCSIDLFARNKALASITNDLNPETQAMHHFEALEFLEHVSTLNVRPDLAIFDPPYSLEQCARSYRDVGRRVTEQDTQIFGRWTAHRDVLAHVLADDAVVLSFGWSSQGMGRKHGFVLEEVLLVCHGGGHNDTICIAERRAQPRLAFGETSQEQTDGGPGPVQDLLR